MKRNHGWKFLRLVNGKICSDYDESEWTVGVERKIEPPKELCKGFNCSKMMEQAKSYEDGDIVALVKYGGKIIKSPDKITSERMTIIRACLFKATALAEYNKVKATAWEKIFAKLAKPEKGEK